MNNTDFRRLVSDTPRRQPNEPTTSQTRPGATPSALGSRMRSSIPMTPRTVKGGAHLDFARQLAERNGTVETTRKFRAMAAPKGSKLASGYTDRVRDRNEDTDKDDREARIQALEEQMKLGQIGRAVFESLRDEITGGDIRATHLVKGLDRKLLERVRRGEDVLSSQTEEEATPTPDGLIPAQAEADEELEKLEATEVASVAHREVVKKGEMLPPPKPLAGVKRSRNDILAELKASREAAKAAAQPQLGSRFRKVGEKNAPGSRVERDEKGREVLITVDEDGRVKRKVRKTPKEEEREKQMASAKLLMPEAGAIPLGMEVPMSATVAAAVASAAEKEDDDIFANVGAAYNPLGDDEAEDDSDASGPEDDSKTLDKPALPTPTPASNVPTPPDVSYSPSTSPPQPQPLSNPSKKQNYFTDTASTNPSTITTASPNPLTDPTILAALSRASTTTASPTITHPEPQHHLLTKLQTHDRDLDDMDLGFGSSRYGDEVDEDETGGGKVKLSQWRGGAQGEGDEDEDDGGKGKGGGKRKRGGKKRKGDKDSVADVLGVLEGRRRAGGGSGG